MAHQSQSRIFKINTIRKGVVDSIHVFYGNMRTTADIQRTFDADPANKLFTHIFDATERETIRDNGIRVVFVGESIYIDDNIGTVKLKLYEALDKVVAMEEMYLYCLGHETLNPINLYQNLTQNDRLKLTGARMEYITKNLYTEQGVQATPALEKKDEYTFDDILGLNLTNTPYLVAQALGQKIVLESEYPFIVDPFSVAAFDPLLELSRKETTTLNGRLLLDVGDIFKNTINLCFAQHVLEAATGSGEYVAKIYYPFLHDLQISTVDALNMHRNELLEENNKLITDNSRRLFDNIRFLHNLYDFQKPSNKFGPNTDVSGVTWFKIVIHPDHKITIPLDNIFKLIHATKEFPFIKLNPDARQENICRLHVTQFTTDGRKIPALPKSLIVKLLKDIAKRKCVAIYASVMTKLKNTTFNVVCEIDANGAITVYPFAELAAPIPIGSGDSQFRNLDELIQLSVNPLIEQISHYLEQNGLVVSKFSTIRDVQVEIRDMKYQEGYFYSSPISANKYRRCLSSAFVIEGSTKDSVRARFKRVSNFNKYDSQTAFVIEKIDQGTLADGIIDELQQNYPELTSDIARDIVGAVITELTVTRGTNRRRMLMVKNNPGFSTVFSTDKINGYVLVKISGINNIRYFNTIPLYINSFIRITQDINSSTVPLAVAKSFCSGDELDEIMFKQIVAVSEKSIGENSVPIVDNTDEALKYRRQENDSQANEHMEQLLDMLGLGDSDESESSQEIEGGAGGHLDSSPEVSSASISSMESISSEHPNNIVAPHGDDIASPKNATDLNIDGSESSEIESSKSKSSVSESESPDSESESSDSESESESSDSESESSDSESESESSDSESEIESEAVVTKNDYALRPDISGMKLKNPNPFTTRLEKRMPQLFVKHINENFSSYSRMCPFSANDQRQPVVLTEDEKNAMVRQNPGKLNAESDFIKYGTDQQDPSKQYYYSCPKYWCLKTDKMVTEQDILDGKCGDPVADVKDAIIPKNATVVPPNKFVYQFYEGDEARYPGFHDKKFPNGSCIPCCYNKWNTPGRTKTRAKCQSSDAAEADPVDEKDELDGYIKGPEKYGPHLGVHRWGHLPISIEKFLNETNAECKAQTDALAPTSSMCLLRHGIETSSTQSFIACIASAIFYAEYCPPSIRLHQAKNQQRIPLIKRFLPHAQHTIPTILEMKKIIIDSLTLDTFITLQNGDLVTIFANPKLDVDVSKHQGTKIFARASSSGNNQVESGKLFLQKVVQAFDMFVAFLNNNDAIIDYTYLWDLVCKPNPSLFKSGINLVILELPEDDITNNVELVCPTNRYSVNAYDPRKASLLLVKRNNFFEPIYGYKNENNSITIAKTFAEYDTSQTVLKTFFSTVVKYTLGEKCRAIPVPVKEYKFQRSVPLDELIPDLLHKKYKIGHQVLNYQSKVVGLLVTHETGVTGFVPCFPSALTTLKTPICATVECEYDYVFMHDDIWQSYDATLKFLKLYYDYQPRAVKSANCGNPRYFCRIVDDEVITGFLTNTNQFIPIKQPVPVSSTALGVKTIRTSDMLVAEKTTLTQNSVDTERTEFIKRIKLETSFYNVFRSTVRMLFNDYSNSAMRKSIQLECNNERILYSAKLTTVVELLRKLVADNVLFVSNHDDYSAMDENNIYACLSKISECKTSNTMCKLSNNKCTLVLPKENLVTKIDNEAYYFEKMADELVRYDRIRSFIFKPQAYLSFGQIKYNLQGDEMIILQSMLTQAFFDSLIPANINTFAKYTTHNIAQPIGDIDYDNIMDKKDIPNNTSIVRPESNAVPSAIIESSKSSADGSDHVQEGPGCKVSHPHAVIRPFLKKYFRSQKEITFGGSNLCSLRMVSFLIVTILNIDVSVTDLKSVLARAYSHLTNNYSDVERVGKIIEILKIENQADAWHIGPDKMFKTLDDVIVQETFTPTNFDIWVILEHYKIPALFISAKPIAHSEKSNNIFACYNDPTVKKYAVIVVPPMFKNASNIYKLILNKDQELMHFPDQISDQSQSEFADAIQQYYSIARYIDHIFAQPPPPPVKRVRNQKQNEDGQVPRKQKQTRKKKASPVGSKTAKNHDNVAILEDIPKHISITELSNIALPSSSVDSSSSSSSSVDSSSSSSSSVDSSSSSSSSVDSSSSSSSAKVSSHKVPSNALSAELLQIHDEGVGSGCIVSQPYTVIRPFLKKYFRSKKEITFGGSKLCSLHMVSFLLVVIFDLNISVTDLRTTLEYAYRYLTAEYRDTDRVSKIIDILKLEHQADAWDIGPDKRFKTLGDIFAQETFTPTNFDIWVLLEYYKLPALFISAKPIVYSGKSNSNIFACYKAHNVKKYIVIVVPPMFKNPSNIYKIILNNDQDLLHNPDNISDSFQRDFVDAIQQFYSVEHYIDHVFVRPLKGVPKPRQTRKKRGSPTGAKTAKNTHS